MTWEKAGIVYIGAGESAGKEGSLFGTPSSMRVSESPALLEED